MHIEKILLRDVGPFDDVTIEFPKGTDPQLADVYLLTGPNGTGKSTILYALASLIAADRVSAAKSAACLIHLVVLRCKVLPVGRSSAGRTLPWRLPPSSRVIRWTPLLS